MFRLKVLLVLPLVGAIQQKRIAPHLREYLPSFTIIIILLGWLRESASHTQLIKTPEQNHKHLQLFLRKEKYYYRCRERIITQQGKRRDKLILETWKMLVHRQIIRKEIIGTVHEKKKLLPRRQKRFRQKCFWQKFLVKKLMTKICHKKFMAKCET